MSLCTCGGNHTNVDGNGGHSVVCPARGKELCANCGDREGTKQWVGSGGGLALIHGFYQMWCEFCVVKEQLKYAEDQAMRIHGLRKRLTELKEQEASGKLSTA